MHGIIYVLLKIFARKEKQQPEVNIKSYRIKQYPFKASLKKTLFRISIKYHRKRMFSVDLNDAHYTVPFKSYFHIFLSFNLK